MMCIFRLVNIFMTSLLIFSFTYVVGNFLPACFVLILTYSTFVFFLVINDKIKGELINCLMTIQCFLFLQNYFSLIIIYSFVIDKKNVFPIIILFLIVSSLISYLIRKELENYLTKSSQENEINLEQYKEDNERLIRQLYIENTEKEKTIDELSNIICLIGEKN